MVRQFSVDVGVVYAREKNEKEIPFEQLVRLTLW